MDAIESLLTNLVARPGIQDASRAVAEADQHSWARDLLINAARALPAEFKDLKKKVFNEQEKLAQKFLSMIPEEVIEEENDDEDGKIREYRLPSSPSDACSACCRELMFSSDSKWVAALLDIDGIEKADLSSVSSMMAAVKPLPAAATPNAIICNEWRCVWQKIAVFLTDLGFIRRHLDAQTAVAVLKEHLISKAVSDEFIEELAAVAYTQWYSPGSSKGPERDELLVLCLLITRSLQPWLVEKLMARMSEMKLHSVHEALCERDERHRKVEDNMAMADEILNMLSKQPADPADLRLWISEAYPDEKDELEFANGDLFVLDSGLGLAADKFTSLAQDLSSVPAEIQEENVETDKLIQDLPGEDPEEQKLKRRKMQN